MRVTALFHTHKESSCDRSENTHTTQHEWQQHRRQTVESVFHERSTTFNGSGHECCSQYHGTYDGTYITFKQVGTHTGYVTHVITYVIGDGSGVERMVFRDTGFHLTHEVGTHIGCLGINATAYTGEERDRRSTEGKAGHHIDDFDSGILTFESIDIGIDQQQGAKAENTQTYHTHTHNRTAAKGDLKGFT